MPDPPFRQLAQFTPSMGEFADQVLGLFARAAATEQVCFDFYVFWSQSHLNFECYIGRRDFGRQPSGI